MGAAATGCPTLRTRSSHKARACAALIGGVGNADTLSGLHASSGGGVVGSMNPRLVTEVSVGLYGTAFLIIMSLLGLLVLGVPS